MFQVQSISDGSLVGIGTLQSAPAPRTSPPVMGGSPCPPTGQPAISSGILENSTFFRLLFLRGWLSQLSILLLEVLTISLFFVPIEVVN